MAFDQLNLAEPLMRAIQERGYEKPTPIQDQAIPVILEGKDVIASAQTGTGKTAAYALPALQQLQQQNGLRAPELPSTPTVRGFRDNLKRSSTNNIRNCRGNDFMHP